MIFSNPIYTSGNNIFVHAETPIEQKDLDNLRKMGVNTVQVDGVPYFNETEDEPSVKNKAESSLNAESGNSDSPIVDIRAISDDQKNKGAYRTYISLIERMNMSLLRISSKDAILENQSISLISAELLYAIKDQREQFVSFILGGKVKGYEMAKSSINTAILSALVTQELKFPNHKTINIIIGALLHDAGMLRLPREITEKRGELSEAERQRMRSHPLLAHRIITKELKYNDEIGDVVLQHHESWDGDGYPYGFTGNKIDVGARIVSIADAFEAMVSQKPYRNPIVGYQAIKNLLADNSRRFDPNLLKVFIYIMGIYPIGSIVLLNNNIVARVTEVRAEAPLRPKIQILIDKDKKIYAGDEEHYIDLLAEKHIYITKAMTAKEIFDLNV